MKTKIEIKTIIGKVLFSFEKENNTIKDVVTKAVNEGADLNGADLNGADLNGAYLNGADLSGAYLRGAYLRGAYLRGADLRGAYLRGADVNGANLSGADLSGAYLSGADLSGAYLSGADLSGAYLSGIKIKKCAVFTGLYKYIVIAVIDEKDVKWIKMGCYTRKATEWEKDFWNNDNEFPNNKSESSKLRVFAYKTALKWFVTIN